MKEKSNLHTPLTAAKAKLVKDGYWQAVVNPSLGYPQIWLHCTGRRAVVTVDGEIVLLKPTQFPEVTLQLRTRKGT